LGDPAAANSVTSVAKDSMIVEPAILQQQRTEEGKEIRRQHKGDKGIPYAHKELTPRGDGITNTLSTVEKDNLLAEPAVLGWTRNEKGEITDRHPVEVANCVTAAKRDNTQNYVVEPQVQQVGQLVPDSKFANPQRGRIDSPAGLAPAVDTAQGGNLVAKIIEQAKTAHPSRGIIMIKNTPCWVRRLTERELFRLMDVDENDIDTLLNAGISNTQLAKLAGNSIVTACMYHIFKNLFIETTPPPNTQTQLF
jgi:site-specific DNA-cytosine methylase